jgi:hypothetical protein
MKSKLPGFTLIFFLLVQCYNGIAQIRLLDTSKIGSHPRLLLKAGAEKGLNLQIARNVQLHKVHDGIIAECDYLIGVDPIERKLIGRRLLDQSREALRRIFYLSYAWRLTDKKKYLKRAEEEMLAISNFTDWNPSHFLDVAEMTTAMAIGYDWLYSGLTAKSRTIIANAIISKGLNPSMMPANNAWLTIENNWNQVCNAGMTFGALAVFELQPTASTKLVDRAINSIKTPMKVYAPDGSYPEGYNYWGYGTTYNVLFIDALEKIFNSDFELLKQPGFMSTPYYYENMVSAANNVFNYSDCGGVDALQPAMFWFASKKNDAAMLWNERNNINTGANTVKWNRFLPAFMLWAKSDDLQNIKAPRNNTWIGKGLNPVAIMRTSWSDPNAIYVGFKGGSPSNSHGHMDAGSFVMDAEGVRWSADLGMQGYESLESKGVKLWDAKQNGQRWQVFRYVNQAHSTLTINNQLQNVSGRAEIITHSADTAFTRAVIDLQAIYPQLKSAKRGIAVVGKQYVIVSDEVETGDSACVVRWNMVTPASIAGKTSQQFELSNKGKKLALYVHNAPEAVLKTWPADPVNSWDALNSNMQMIGYEIAIPANTRKEIVVFLVPGEQQLSVKKSFLLPLAQW